MATNITLAQFNKIASGDYNAGQIDFRTKDDGSTELVKVNNHVWKTSKNQTILSPERILEVKLAFLHALQNGGVRPEAMNEIRNRLGLPAEIDMLTNKAERTDFLKMRFAPLTRAQVRSILDEFANEGLGFTKASRTAVTWEDLEAGRATANMSAKHLRRRDNANVASMAAHSAKGGDGVRYSVTDAMSLLSMRSLAELDATRSRRIGGMNAVNDRLKQHTSLVNSFRGLVGQALKLLPANVRETSEFKLAGVSVKLVKDDNGNLSAVIGKDQLAIKVDLKVSAEEFVGRLIGRTVAEADTLGASTAKGILATLYDRDLESGLVVSERTSLTRQFAALVLTNKSDGKVDVDSLIKGNYNTGILVEMAERALDGEKVGDTKALLDAYHDKLRSDNADLPPEMKAMLENVANLSLEKPNKGDGEFVVKAPIVNDIGEVVKAMPPPPPGPVATVPRDIGGLNGIKDFVADLVFSDDTMVGDVTVNKTGGAMRKILTSDRNVIALAEIIKDPTLIDRACAPQIADAVKDGLGKMVDILDAEFKKANNGKSLTVAATEDDFLAQLSLFMKDEAKMPGAELAKFDNLILAMANKGCENIQQFINNVFQVGNANVNAQGSIVNDPYKNMSAKDIKTMLDGKSLNQILDSAANADSPGQVGFFRQVISTYFTSLGKADKRSCFAAAMKYAQTFDFTGLENQALVSAQEAAINKFTGAILKGTSPLLQKMMQGLPKDIMGKYADALDDMKSSLAPIPRKVVQAHFMKMINDSKGKGPGKEIESIELKKSLGAASVGEAFLCAFKIKGEKEPRQLVVKIMRHDAERRVKAEAEIFTAAAEKIGPGMAKTWEGQLNQYMTEFDFRHEAGNVNIGVGLYDIANTEGHALKLIAPNVASMKVSTIVDPAKDVMVVEVARGKPVDKFFKEKITEIRKACSSVFEQDSATGRFKWTDGPIDPKTGTPKKVPIVKPGVSNDVLPNMIDWCREQYKGVKESQKLLVQATKAWFHEALLGSGKFHGDTHSGNLMISNGEITFIDFGNLYELKADRTLLDKSGNPVLDPKTNQPVTVNERHELLRVIMGATFRDKKFILDGFEKLLSPAGKAALAANREKAEAVLEAVLAKGRFSYDMVYRLNAAVSELQKLGIELPPAINCFVQSMARLSNTLSEMNTIINQTSVLLETADDYVRQGPAPERDELDILGMAFDFRSSAEGKVPVEDDESVVGLTKNNVPVPISAYTHALTVEGFGGHSIEGGALGPGGSYHNLVKNRIATAQNPVEGAKGVIGILKAHLTAGHIAASNGSFIETLEKDAIQTLSTDLAAADTPEKRAAAISAFAMQYCSMIKLIFSSMQESEGTLVTMRTFESVEGPSSFANAVLTTLMDQLDAMMGTTFASVKGDLIKDILAIGDKDLKLSYWSMMTDQEGVIRKIKEDSFKMAGDNSYQVDIGV